MSDRERLKRTQQLDKAFFGSGSRPASRATHAQVTHAVSRRYWAHASRDTVYAACMHNACVQACRCLQVPQQKAPGMGG